MRCIQKLFFTATDNVLENKITGSGNNLNKNERNAVEIFFPLFSSFLFKRLNTLGYLFYY